jgi:hypothetical protein
MCCQTHTPAYVFKGSLLVQAEEEAFRCQCPCLGCPRRATGEDLRCDVCRNPPAVTSGGMSPWGRAGGQAVSFYEAEYARWEYEPFEFEQTVELGWDPGPGLELGRPQDLRLSPGAQERVARMMREGLPAGSFPVVNGVARGRRWEPSGPVRPGPQQFAAGNFRVDGGSPLA